VDPGTIVPYVKKKKDIAMVPSGIFLFVTTCSDYKARIIINIYDSPVLWPPPPEAYPRPLY
jgi:hypothetical protein